MGMYTRMSCAIQIKDDKLVKWIKKNYSKSFKEWPNLSPFDNHKVFESERWKSLMFGRDDSYFDIEPLSQLELCGCRNKFIWTIDTCIKNYGMEIFHYFDWIKQFTNDEVLGFWQYEECESRNYILKDTVIFDDKREMEK